MEESGRGGGFAKILMVFNVRVCWGWDFKGTLSFACALQPVMPCSRDDQGFVVPDLCTSFLGKVHQV